ncbi:phospholipase A and acyltransferase 4-like [Suricata suricatta]|uniref:phospholipase A and acyltransferase 4-like n=1 Tax=Suricata suricatta TaxID=37032 RepID=UPI00115636B0|nr:phospholipase A and acyltransferase 4-like [Suricata suricatta]
MQHKSLTSLNICQVASTPRTARILIRPDRRGLEGEGQEGCGSVSSRVDVPTLEGTESEEQMPGVAMDSQSQGDVMSTEKGRLPTPSWVFLLQFRREPKPGDLIEIFHIGYEHWAIYVGDGYVIHLVPPGDLGTRSTIVCSIPSSKAVVKQELLKDVVGNCFYRINNHLDHEYRPEPVNKIIRSAKEKIGERMEYSLLENNCEHFVTNLRYGWPHSKQVEDALTGGKITIALGVLNLIGLVLVGTHIQIQ